MSYFPVWVIDSSKISQLFELSYDVHKLKIILFWKFPFCLTHCVQIVQMDKNMSFSESTEPPRREYRSLFENVNGRRLFRPPTAASSSNLSANSAESNSLRSNSIVTSSNSSSTLAQSLSSSSSSQQVRSRARTYDYGFIFVNVKWETKKNAENWEQHPHLR